jgi:2-polyprenyl-6-methoxyphenol hydroxylase-like FAD-dependent oxidoreductase
MIISCPESDHRHWKPLEQTKIKRMHIIILGAGPAGLSAALSLAAQSTPSSPIRITLLELRPAPQTIGGAVNLTPLALSYLSSLGVLARLAGQGGSTRAFDMVSLLTGTLMGTIYIGAGSQAGAESRRVVRNVVVNAMLDEVRDGPHKDVVDVRFGARVVGIQETEDGDGGGQISVELECGETVAADVLLGCDGLHSAARQLWVEPGREKVYTGWASPMGSFPAVRPGDSGVRLVGGQEALRNGACIMTGMHGPLVFAFSNPDKTSVFLGTATRVDEPSGSANQREGWKAMGKDREVILASIRRSMEGTPITGIGEALERSVDWGIYPIYIMPPGGRWSKGRCLLLGDAAHAVS